MRTIDEQNKMINEFMGIKPVKTSTHYSWSDSPFFFVTEDTEEKVINAIAAYSKYHISWDWLMPVIEKILEIDTYREPRQKVFVAITPDINKTWNAVIKFIEWYNANK